MQRLHVVSNPTFDFFMGYICYLELFIYCQRYYEYIGVPTYLNDDKVVQYFSVNTCLYQNTYKTHVLPKLKKKSSKIYAEG